MPRAARKRSNTGIYHVILRGHNRQEIFKDNEDSTRFLHTLKKYQEPGDYRLYAYCLMTNHVHLLIKEEKNELGIIMRRIGASYVYWYNWKYERSGHLFQDRFRSEAVEDDQYFLTVLRYIHQNPVKAGLAKKPGDYKWSSYKEIIRNPEIVHADYVLGFFNPNREAAIEEYKTFHKTIENASCLEIDEQKKYKDAEAEEIIKNTCNVSSCSQINSVEKTERDVLLKALKEKGLSTRQIARLTGVNRNVILKA